MINILLAIKGKITETGTKTIETSKKGITYPRQDIELDDGTKEVCRYYWDNLDYVLRFKNIIYPLDQYWFMGALPWKDRNHWWSRNHNSKSGV